MKTLPLLLVWFLLLMFMNVKADITIDTNRQITVGNETYLVNDTTRTFSRIMRSNNFVVFNNTGFNVTSANPITIYIDFINSSFDSASDDDLVLEFIADTNAGNVNFTINGFKPNTDYTIKRNGTIVNTTTSNGVGQLSFDNNVWSKKAFEVFHGVDEPVTLENITLSNVYPSNNSVNIPLQPILYATFNHSSGKTMNCSWFYGLSLGNESILLGVDVNFTNSTQDQLFVQASNRSTSYFWRAMINDSVNTVNFTFNFRTEGYPGGVGTIQGNNGALGIAAGGIILAVVAIMFYLMKRRKDEEDENY